MIEAGWPTCPYLRPTSSTRSATTKPRRYAVVSYLSHLPHLISINKTLYLATV